MRKIFLLAAIGVCLALLPTAAFAKGPKEKSTKSKASHSDTDKTKKTKGHETAAKDKTGDDRPAGWDQGKKTGWGDCDVPPGQAKPEGCKDDGHQHAKGEKSKSHEVDKDKGKSKGTQTAAAKKTTTATTTQTTAQKAKGTGTAATSTTTTKKRTPRAKDPETLKPTKAE